MEDFSVLQVQEEQVSVLFFSLSLSLSLWEVKLSVRVFFISLS
jgi:hypothetical protein